MSRSSTRLSVGLLVALVFMTSVARGQEVSQKYQPWQKKVSPAGVPFFESVYTATDKDGKIVNRQLAWYVPASPAGDKTDLSNHWVYWYNPTKQAIWARCPTPKHPQYKQMQEDAKGKDLWQLIPEEKRQPGVTGISKVAPNFGKTISSEASGLPKVAKDKKAVIDCVDFSNAIFN